jgi:hypothetical protein
VINFSACNILPPKKKGTNDTAAHPQPLHSPTHAQKTALLMFDELLNKAKNLLGFGADPVPDCEFAKRLETVLTSKKGSLAQNKEIQTDVSSIFLQFDEKNNSECDFKKKSVLSPFTFIFFSRLIFVDIFQFRQQKK